MLDVLYTVFLNKENVIKKLRKRKHIYNILKIHL